MESIKEKAEELSTAFRKEQGDLLFQKMHEAGYEWDAEKKELKKIEQKPADTEKGAKWNEREIPNSAWSEEDEDVINHLLAICAGAKRYRRQFAGCLQEDITKYQTWLKSLKERYTWKPSDEQMITLRQVISGCSYDIEPLVEMEEQLKKLREE